MTLLKRATSLLGLVVLFSLISACSAPQSRQLAQDWPEALPASTDLSNVPFYPQERYQCGPAALATVLSYRGIEIAPDDLVNEIYIPGREGSLRTEIVAAARARGLIAYRIPKTLRALLDELDAGHPVLVMQNLALEWSPKWHFAVAVGYDRDRDFINLRSGTIANHRSEFSRFEHTWERADYWGLVILDPDENPVSAEPIEYLRAASALENRGHSNDAAAAYTTAARHWPENSLALMASGNSAFKRGNYAGAESEFLRATRVDNESVAAWNNLANVYLKRGCVSAANTAVQCALSLSPDNEHVQSTLADVLGSTQSESFACSVAYCASN